MAALTSEVDTLVASLQPIESGERSGPPRRSGERTSPSTKDEGGPLLRSENKGRSSAFVTDPGQRGRKLRESRKTPFRLSPLPRGFDAASDDLDEILETQRLEDTRTASSFPSDPPKRKREVLSDREYELRKERTADNLVEGIRRVRGRSLSPSWPSSPTELLTPEAKEQGEQLDRRDKPVPDDLEPPPSLLLGVNKDDPDSDEDSSAGIGNQIFTALRIEDNYPDPGKCERTRIVLTVRQLRRIMAAKENLFKFGVFVPRSEREAKASPEAPRWKAGRDLEWLRLGEQGTFERDWTWARIQAEFASYKKSDIGFLFYVYDYKYSGEHRVRLVFDGSRQSAETYDETYAPTARQESVRIFHVVCVEESYGMGQYDVPQAFLKAFIDFDIFVYPPRGQAEFDGQILKLRRALYGGKQSAFLWFKLMNEFILELGFVASTFDKCLYRREDAILILFCDDLRIGASDPVLQVLHSAFLPSSG
jgi:hypothetical protein